MTDPKTGRVLGVEEQVQPENNEVKKIVLQKVVGSYANLNALIHDRCCSLQPDCERSGLFTSIHYWIIDKWHGAKHKKTCKCRP